MSCVLDEDGPFPANYDLFADTFSVHNEYKFMGEELRISQLFGANLGVAAPVWEAVRLVFGSSVFLNGVLQI